MKVTRMAILLVLVEAQAVVPETGVEVRCQDGDPMPDPREALLAALLEVAQVLELRALEWEQEDLLQLVEPGVDSEEA